MSDVPGAPGFSGESRPEELEGEVLRLKAMLLQSAKLAELGTRVATLVHEMNQPLVAIKAFAQMIKGTSNDEDTVRRATLIEEQAEVLVSLIDRVRVHARQGSKNKRSDLRAAVNGAIQLLGHVFRKSRVELEVEVEDVPLGVPLDEVHLQQVLVNLVMNAVDAVENVDDRRVRIFAGRRGDDVRLSIADSGPGIPKDIEVQILDPFFTTKPPEKGTGLGLPICKEIVGSVGGTLSIQSALALDLCEGFRPGAKGPGFRTVVEVRLPAVSDESFRGAADGGIE